MPEQKDLKGNESKDAALTYKKIYCMTKNFISEPSQKNTLALIFDRESLQRIMSQNNNKDDIAGIFSMHPDGAMTVCLVRVEKNGSEYKVHREHSNGDFPVDGEQIWPSVSIEQFDTFMTTPTWLPGDKQC